MLHKIEEEGSEFIVNEPSQSESDYKAVRISLLSVIIPKAGQNVSFSLPELQIYCS